MVEKLTNLDVFDLLSERQMRCRKTIETMWNEKSNIQLSNSDWFVLYRLYDQKETVVELCKNVDITRQAMHKLIKKLEEHGLVRTHLMKNRVKYVEITDLGIECYEKHKALKTKLENQIKNTIGEEELNQLKRILSANWNF